ncbi:MAG TPA: ArsR family transcriptional regulator [Acidimicrobiales bacterium]|nr:ArsR family transcriptional regulator [Acidimicrobiales bacterium]
MTQQPPEPPLATMPTTRRAILMALKRNGTMHANDLARHLGVTVAAVRQQLARLGEDGLVTHRRDPDGRGRPSHSYELTPAADGLFPKRYGDLTTELLGYLGGPDSAEVGGLFERRRRRRLADARERLRERPLEDRVAELTRILDEDGYLADVERLDDGGWRITEHNCAILSVATGFRQACSSELAFIRDALPGARVERVAHLMDGAHVCAYEVHPTGGAPSGRRARRPRTASR